MCPLNHDVYLCSWTGVNNQDLILFPSDATFQKVEQSAWGRTYVLKFSSSDQRHFVRLVLLSSHIQHTHVVQFWMQVASPLYYTVA